MNNNAFLKPFAIPENILNSTNFRNRMEYQADCSAHGKTAHIVIAIKNKDGEWNKTLASGTCLKCNEEIKEEERQKQLKAINQSEHYKNVHIKDKIKEVGFVTDVERWSLDTLSFNTKEQKEMLDHVKKWYSNIKKREYSNLVLTGSIGCGKTLLVSCMVKYMIEECIVLNASYLDCNTLIQWSQLPFSERQKKISEISRSEVLILDEVRGSESKSFKIEEAKLLIESILYDRYDKQKACCIISNLEKKDLTVFLGKRLSDRFMYAKKTTIMYHCQGETRR